MKRALRWLALVGLAALACSNNDCDLNDDIRQFAGDTALDCGTADEAHDRADIDACAVGAFEAGTAFIARYRQQGTDSVLVTAVAMNTAGKVELFRWDSSPCGGGDCRPTTDVQSCESASVSPTTSEDPNVLPITCESLGLAQRICG
jgi:hypothetical protein